MVDPNRSLLNGLGDAPPPGTVPINDRIRKCIAQRKKELKKKLDRPEHLFEQYPRDQVRRILAENGVEL